MTCVLSDFLKAHRYTDKSTVITHTIMPGGYKGYPWGKFEIPLDKQDELVESLSNVVFNPKIDDKTKNIPIVECIPQSRIKPITLDFDFRYPITVTTRQHTNNHISHITNLISQAINQYLDVPRYEIHIFERKTPYVEDKKIKVLKDGIHFILPEVVCHVDVQHLIRKNILLNIDEHVFKNSDIGVLPLINDPESVIDKAVISTNPWMMYGASKPGKLPYELTNIILVENDPNNTENPILLSWVPVFPSNNADLIKRYSLNGKEEQEIKIKSDKLHELDKKIKVVPNIKKPSKKKVELRSSTQIEHDKELASKLIKLIDPKRADDYNEWIDICWILRGISNDADMYQLFIDFSQSSSKFDEENCQMIWNGDSSRDTKTIGSLCRLAKIDNIEAYNIIWTSSLDQYIDYSLSCTTFDVANVIYQMFKDVYVCTSAKGNEWFEFHDHLWHRCEGGVTLKKKINNEVLNLYLNKIKSYVNQSMSISSENENDSTEQDKNTCLYKSKALTELTYKLRDQTFKDKLMKECTTMFYNGKWIERLDSNLLLIGFENGVYDLKKKEFRDGHPDDLISISTGKNYNIDAPKYIMDEINFFLSQLFPVARIKHYVLKTMSSFLQGTNPDEKFHVWSGVGGNGKSKLLELLEKTLGDYAGKLNISMLTEKRPASTIANPELARTRGKRLCSFQEPDEGAKINIGLVKELTGGDKIICRSLFKESFEMNPQFKLLLCCNHKPKVPADEESTWRRFLIVEFQSKFIQNPNPNNPNEFTRDVTVSSEKIPIWSQYFMNLLIEYYYIYKTEGLAPPEEILNATNEYKLDTDEYLQFIKEHLTEDKESNVKIDEAYAVFKAWYDTNYSKKAVSRKEFKNHIERKLKQPNSSYWIGWRLNLFGNQTSIIQKVLTPMEWMEENTEEGNDGTKVTIGDCIYRYKEEIGIDITNNAWGKQVKFDISVNKVKYYTNRKWKK